MLPVMQVMDSPSSSTPTHTLPHSAPQTCAPQTTGFAAPNLPTEGLLLNSSSRDSPRRSPHATSSRSPSPEKASRPAAVRHLSSPPHSYGPDPTQGRAEEDTQSARQNVIESSSIPRFSSEPSPSNDVGDDDGYLAPVDPRNSQRSFHSTPDELDIDPLDDASSTMLSIASQRSEPPLGSLSRLTEADLLSTRVKIVTSTIRPNDRGKEVLSFIISVAPRGKEPWRIEKLYSDVLALDSKVRSMLNRNQMKKVSSLPDSKLFRDNAPAKVDQRKAVLEHYLQNAMQAPVKKPVEVCYFFNTNIMNDTRAPVASVGYKEGYLTKRGKNFGGWKTRYFVLMGPVLEYYESVCGLVLFAARHH